jgi:hypothetical protein
LGEIFLLKSEIQVGDIIVTLSLAEETFLPVLDENREQIQAWLDEITEAIRRQIKMGFESDMDKAILRAIRANKRKC